MEILGLHPAILALGIVIVGITLRTIIGFLGKTKNEFNPNQLALSFILGFFASIQLVIVAIENLSASADELVQLSFVTGQIAVVMGIDAGIKSGGKAIARRNKNKNGNVNNNSSNNNQNENLEDFIDDESNETETTPPGKIN